VADAIRIEGLRELERAFRASEDDLRRELQRELNEAGKIVAEDARGRLARYSARSAGGIRSRIKRRTEVVVEQRRRRTTGRRPDWGSFQMREVLIPARSARIREVEQRLENMLDRIGRANGF
jgi:hypothetical protein